MSYFNNMRKNWTLQALIVSGLLNAVLIVLLLFVMVKEHPKRLVLSFRPYKGQPITPPLDYASYEVIKNKSYQDLVGLLEDHTRLRAGYRLCDIALGILVTEHDVDIGHALGRTVRSKMFFNRAVVFEQLSRRDFRRIGLFIRKNRYPFTACGLHRRLPQTAEVFMCTEEYRLVQTFMHRLHPMFSHSTTLITLCQQTPWVLLESFCRQQKQQAEMTTERALNFLVDAVYAGSRTAAYLLVIYSSGHTLEEFDHATVMQILSLLDVKTQEAVSCCQSLAHSQRPVAIVEKARAFLTKKA